MRLPPAVIAPPLHLIYKLWCKSLSYEEFGRARIDELDGKGQRLIFSLWHDELFALIYKKRQLDIVTVVSRSRDGEYLTQVMQRFGLRTVRGSSSRGGVSALHQTVTLMQNDFCHSCVTVDGPRGPRHKAKNGVIFLASRVPALITPVRIIYKRAAHFKSWDKFQLPLPFSKVRIIYGEPYPIEASTLSKQDFTGECRRLEYKLDELGKRYPFL